MGTENPELTILLLAFNLPFNNLFIIKPTDESIKVKSLVACLGYRRSDKFQTDLNMFTALYSDSITLYLINNENLADVQSMLKDFPDADYMLNELSENYVPKYRDGRRIRYGFYSMLGDELAGLTLLDIDSWETLTGSTGADTLEHMRGKGAAPRSKPHLFYLAFEILKLNRVETGCFVSNLSSKKSIEKTAGFRFEGIKRESGINEQGEFEDETFYAILRRDWEVLYDKSQIKVIGQTASS